MHIWISLYLVYLKNFQYFLLQENRDLDIYWIYKVLLMWPHIKLWIAKLVTVVLPYQSPFWHDNRHFCSLTNKNWLYTPEVTAFVFSCSLFSLLCRQAVPGGVYQRCQKRPVHRPATPVWPQLGLPVLNAQHHCAATVLWPFLLHSLCCYWNSHANQCMLVLISHIIIFSVTVCKDGGGV